MLRYSIWWRKLLHKPIVWLSKRVHRFLRNNTVKLVQDEFQANGNPTIYAATHVYYGDVASALTTINDNVFLLFGGVGERHKITDWIGIWLNGYIPVRRWDKKDRQKSLNKCLQILNKRGNILIFPEGTYNLSPNLPVKKLWWGLLEIAEKSNANIVPVAIQRVDDEHCVIIGKRFERENFSSKLAQIDALRDEMATLVWELLEMSPSVKREEITDDYWLAFIQENLLKYIPKVSLSEEESYEYTPRGEISLSKLLAEMHGIEYKSMAADYKTHRQIEKLIKGWTR